MENLTMAKVLNPTWLPKGMDGVPSNVYEAAQRLQLARIRVGTYLWTKKTRTGPNHVYQSPREITEVFTAPDGRVEAIAIAGVDRDHPVLPFAKKSNRMAVTHNSAMLRWVIRPTYLDLADPLNPDEEYAETPAETCFGALILEACEKVGYEPLLEAAGVRRHPRPRPDAAPTPQQVATAPDVVDVSTLGSVLHAATLEENTEALRENTAMLERFIAVVSAARVSPSHQTFLVEDVDDSLVAAPSDIVRIHCHVLVVTPKDGVGVWPSKWGGKEADDEPIWLARSMIENGADVTRGASLDLYIMQDVANKKGLLEAAPPRRRLS